MATITLQFGQYGNQLGPTFFNTVLDYSQQLGTDLSPWFDSVQGSAALTARAVLVDMEPKAIMRSCINNGALRFGYKGTRVVHGQSGSGNNWAYGYMVHGPREMGKIHNAIRKCSEACDRVDSFFSISSLAGGTGSGLGSYVISHLRDEYPKNTILCNCVLPFAAGEVLTQQYNTSLSLATLLQEADGILLFGNDEATTIYQQSRKHQAGLLRPSLLELNDVIGHTLAYNVLGSKRPITDLIQDTVPSTLYKLLAPRCIPSKVTAETRNDAKLYMLASHCRQMMLTGSASDTCIDWTAKLEQNNFFQQLVKARVIFRAEDAQALTSGAVTTPAYLKLEDLPREQTAKMTRLQLQTLKGERLKMKEAYELLVTPDIERLFPRFYCNSRFGAYPIHLLGYPRGLSFGRSAGLVMNGNLFNDQLVNLTLDMTNRIRAGAYLWHYESFGVDKDVIYDSLMTLTQVIEDYKLKK